MADGNITVKVSTQAAQAELERLRAENAALKRDLQYARGTGLRRAARGCEKTTSCCARR